MGKTGYCKVYRCRECKYYMKYLSFTLMQEICWNDGNYYEPKG